MKKHAIITLIAMALATGATAQITDTTGQNSNVSVSISNITAIDVRPSDLSYNNVAPGADRDTSADGYEHIEIENIGSARVGEIYAQSTLPTTQPFGTDAASVTAPHNTGNFVTMSLSTAQSYGIGGLSDTTTPHAVNRVEYFEENYPTYIDVDNVDDSINTTNVDSTVSRVEVGRFRVGGAEYFFALYETDGGSSVLRVGDTPHTSTQLGTTDLQTDVEGAEDYTEYDTSGTMSSGVDNNGAVLQINGHPLVSFNTTNDEFTGQSLINDGSVNSTATGELSDVEQRNYNVFIDPNNNFALRTKFNVNVEVPGGYNSGLGSADDNWNVPTQTAGQQEYILNAGNVGEALQPGQNFPIDFGIQIPQGVDQNAIQEGTVTLIASGDTTT